MEYTNSQVRDGEPPPAMMTLYEILHERHINDAATVKVLQNMYLE